MVGLHFTKKHSFVFKKIGENYKTLALMRDPHFPLVTLCLSGFFLARIYIIYTSSIINTHQMTLLLINNHTCIWFPLITGRPTRTMVDFVREWSKKRQSSS